MPIQTENYYLQDELDEIARDIIDTRFPTLTEPEISRLSKAVIKEQVPTTLSVKQAHRRLNSRITKFVKEYWPWLIQRIPRTSSLHGKLDRKRSRSDDPSVIGLDDVIATETPHAKRQEAISKDIKRSTARAEAVINKLPTKKGDIIRKVLDHPDVDFDNSFREMEKATGINRRTLQRTLITARERDCVAILNEANRRGIRVTKTKVVAETPTLWYTLPSDYKEPYIPTGMPTISYIGIAIKQRKGYSKTNTPSTEKKVYKQRPRQTHKGKVEHPTFGTGIIIEEDNQYSDKITLWFDGFGQKTIKKDFLGIHYLKSVRPPWWNDIS